MKGYFFDKFIAPTKGGGQSWSSYWTSLISATVEDADPDGIVLTFPSAQASLTDTDFTVTVNGGAVAVSSASWTGVALTLELASDVSYGDVVVVTFVKSGGTANVTNNVAAEAELTTYITGLTTALTQETRRKINEVIKGLKTAWSVADLDDGDDVQYLLAGETAESSLKNLVKDAHHATAVNSPTFTAFEGFKFDGISQYLNSNYNPTVHTVTYQLNNCHALVYSRTEVAETVNEFRATNQTIIGLSITIRSAINEIGARINGSLGTPFTNTSSLGIFGYNSGANNNYVINGVFTGNVNINNSFLVTLNVYIGCSNSNGTPALFCSKQLAFFDMGKSLSEAQHAATKNVIEAYMDSNGKGVIA